MVMNLLYNKSIFTAIIISILVTIPLFIVDHFVYNGVVNFGVPIIFIFTISILMRRVEFLAWYHLLFILVMIAGTVYIALPTYSLSEAESVIQQKFQEAETIKIKENTPIKSDSFNPFNPRWFYTFQVIHVNGMVYTLMFNPDSGETLEKKY